MIDYVIEDTECHPVIAINCTTSTDQKKISQTIRKAYGTLAQYIQETGSFPLGPALTIYHVFDDDKTNFDVCFPVMPELLQNAKDDIIVTETPSGKAAKAIHKGPYRTLFKTYMALYKAVKEDGIEHGEKAWEVYLDSPGQTAEDEMLTQVYISLH